MPKFIYTFSIAFLLFQSCKQEPPAIKGFYVETTPCFDSCPVFTMGFHPDRTVTYKAGRYNRDTGVFTATLPPKQYDSLLVLLQQTDFPSLNENYAVDWMDAPTMKLTIMYGENQIKRIKDYGQSGTEELKRLYHFVFALKDHYQWKRM